MLSRPCTSLSHWSDADVLIKRVVSCVLLASRVCLSASGSQYAVRLRALVGWCDQSYCRTEWAFFNFLVHERWDGRCLTSCNCACNVTAKGFTSVCYVIVCGRGMRLQSA